VILVDSISKSFAFKGKRKRGESKRIVAVEDVSFTAADGSITGLLGSNGAGKSTTLRILATLMHADEGNASIDGYDIKKSPLSVRQTIGFMPHNAGIYPRLTARENIEYYARICGVSRKDSEAKIKQLVDMLDMASFIDRRAQGFSQGQRTKVGLGRALVHSPTDAGHCVLFSSHIMQEVEALCDHIAIIANGKIAMEDTLPGILGTTGHDNLEDAFVHIIQPSTAPANTPDIDLDQPATANSTRTQ